MKNFKKVLSLVLALSLLVSTMTISFAAADTTAEKADVLNALGLLNGVSTEEFDPALDVEANRQTAMVLLARAFGWELDEEATTDFEDVADWAVPAVAKAVELGVTKGMGEGVYGALEMVTARQVATWVARLLTGSETAWEDNADLDNEEEVTRGGLVDVIWETLSQTPVGAEKSLIETIIGDDADLLAVAQEAGLVEVVVETELAVDSVTATNAKEVVVTFNKAVDETEGKKVANYTVKKADATDLVVSAVALSDDLTVATLTLTTEMVNYSTANTIKVLKAVGLAADYTGTVGVADATVPTLVSVEATGPRELTLTFSEPVKNAVNTAFKLDNGTVALGTVTAAGTKLTLNTLADLTEGAHSLELLANTAIVDYVGLVVKPATYAFNYAKDLTVPTVTVKESSEYTVTLKFSKNVTNVNTAAVLFSHTYDGQNQVAGNAAVTGSGSEYVVTFNNALAPGTSNIYIGYASGTTDANKIKDNFGNVLAATTLQVTTSVDNTAPVAEKVEFKSSTTVEVTFSEKVDNATATDKANYTVKDSAGTAVTVSGVTLDGTAKIATVTFATINAGGDYTLTVKNVKDTSIAKNKMADTTLVFTATDKVAPTIVDADTVAANVQAQKVADKKFIVKFSEAMDSASITNKANYLVNGVALASGDTITAVDSNKGALITFAADPGAVNLTVGRVADAAGNLVAAFSTTVELPAGVSNPLFDKAEVLTKNTVKLYFKEVITGAVADDFQVDPGDNTFDNVTGISVTVVDSKTEIILTIADDITAANAAAGNVEVKVTGVVDAKNAYGAAVVLGATVAADKMAPSATAYATLDVDGDAKIDHIRVTFDEAIFAGSVSLDKFTVADYTVTDAYASTSAPTAGNARTGATVADSTVVYVRVTEKTDVDGAAVPKVSIAAGIKDVAGNAFAAVTDKATTDLVAPIVTAVATIATKTVVFTFSEAVYSVNAAPLTDVVIGDFTITDNNNATIGAPTLTVSADKKTVTIVFAGTTEAGDQVTLDAADVYDAAGNVAATLTATF